MIPIIETKSRKYNWNNEEIDKILNIHNDSNGVFIDYYLRYIFSKFQKNDLKDGRAENFCTNKEAYEHYEIILFKT